eukprot:2401790-Amphidinium_carterae.1
MPHDSSLTTAVSGHGLHGAAQRVVCLVSQLGRGNFAHVAGGESSDDDYSDTHDSDFDEDLPPLGPQANLRHHTCSTDAQSLLVLRSSLISGALSLPEVVLQAPARLAPEIRRVEFATNFARLPVAVQASGKNTVRNNSLVRPNLTGRLEERLRRQNLGSRFLHDRHRQPGTRPGLRLSLSFRSVQPEAKSV